MNSLEKASDNLESAGDEAKGIVRNVAGRGAISFPQFSSEYKAHTVSLSDNMQGMNDNFGLLNNEMNSATGVIVDDLQSIADQFNVIMNLYADAIDGVLEKDYSNTFEDVSLEERVRRANKWHDATNGRSVLISIHANAGGGTGFEVYTSLGTTKADRIATIIFNSIKAAFPGMKMRSDDSDGDPDKEAGFYILKNTRCPATLVENLFMDNYADCRFLFQEDFKNRLADAYVEAMRKIDEL